MKTGIVVELFNKERAGAGEYVACKNVKSENPLAFKDVLSEKIAEKTKNIINDKKQSDTSTETQKSEKDPLFSIISLLGLTEGKINSLEYGDKNNKVLSLLQKLIETVSKMEISKKGNGLKDLLADGTDIKGLETLLQKLSDVKGEEKLNITDLLEGGTLDINPGNIISSLIKKVEEIKEHKTEGADKNQERALQDMQQILASFLTSLKEVVNNSKINNGGETTTSQQKPSIEDKILNTSILKLSQDLKDFLTLTGKLESYISDKNNKNSFIQIDNNLLTKSPLVFGSTELMKEITDLVNRDRKDIKEEKAKDINIEKLESLISILEQNGIKPQKEEKNLHINTSQFKNISLDDKETKSDNNILNLRDLMPSTINNGNKEVAGGEEKFQSVLSSEVNVSEQLIKKINWKTNEKYSEASITLEPESLGKVRVEIISAGGEISAKFYTGTKEAGDLLRQQLNQLRENLSSHGLKLGEFSVLLNQQNMPSFNNQTGYSFNGKKYTPTPEQIKVDIDKSRTMVKTSSSQMDYFV